MSISERLRAAGTDDEPFQMRTLSRRHTKLPDKSFGGRALIAKCIRMDGFRPGSEEVDQA